MSVIMNVSSALWSVVLLNIKTYFLVSSLIAQLVTFLNGACGQSLAPLMCVCWTFLPHFMDTFFCLETIPECRLCNVKSIEQLWLLVNSIN